MSLYRILIASFFLFMSFQTYAATTIKGIVYDAKSKEAVPFATIRFGNTGQGMVADLYGKFEIPEKYVAELPFIEVSGTGYKKQHIDHPAEVLNIFLVQDDNTLGEFSFTPPYEKMRRIINKAIANKPQNNPDNYDWYRCHVYYKMLVDASLPDSMANDTSKKINSLVAFFTDQHLLMSESYSIRTWRKPKQLQEDVLATKFSGLTKSSFTSLITDFQPFHAYDDYLKLNGKDYHSPVSKGFEQNYIFNLSDEFMQDNDTVWVLSFIPRGNRSNGIVGKVYVNSDGYAISQITARTADTALTMNVKIEQQYERVAWGEKGRRWFPAHLNYVLEFKIKTLKRDICYHMRGNSKIDSLNWIEDQNFRFDKAHTVRLADKADALTDQAWAGYRPESLSTKEQTTYRVIDSIGKDAKVDQLITYVSKLPDGKVPIGPIDLAINRLFSTNAYENMRLGLGAQTNEQLIKWLSVGGWAGYGLRDYQWKYGAFAEVYIDKYKEFVIRAGYSKDLSEPGRVHLNRDLDKSYLKSLLLSRVDEVTEYTASVKKKLGYLDVELAGKMQDYVPMYKYHLSVNGNDMYTFSANEASLSLRYAFAERTAPFFGMYTRSGRNNYPVFYCKFTSGVINGNKTELTYNQLLAAVYLQQHINRIGQERVLVEAGKSWSDGPLPLSKLFAGNGFKYESKSNIGFYTFGGLMAMYPYEYYSDQFVHAIWRHDFDWKLFVLQNKKSVESLAPNLAVQYNMLYGTLDQMAAQRDVAFSVPDNAYHEVGLILNNLIRLRFLNLYYITCSVGYFYHVEPGDFNDKNGRIVYGFGVEL